MYKSLCFILLAGASLISCRSDSGLAFSTEIPPLALVPAIAAAVIDDRGRFRALFCGVTAAHGADLSHNRPCDLALHRLLGEMPGLAVPLPGADAFRDVRLVIVPGIFGECVARYALPFSDAQAHLRRSHGLQSMEWIPVSGRSSSAANAAFIARWLQEHPTPSGRRLVLLGYSKGATDLIEAVSRYPEAIPAGTPIVGVAAVVAGTPIADRGETLYGAFARLRLPGCKPGDGAGVTSLTRRERLAWLAAHPMPTKFRYYSLPAFARTENVSRALRPSNSLLASHDDRNDGQVLIQDAVIPGSRLLGYANADHWAVTLPLSENMPGARVLLDRNAYPRTVLLESILATVVKDF